MKLHGTKTVITGASGGIGRAVTLRFLREGAEVFAVARNHKELAELETLARSQNFSLQVQTADVSRVSDVRAVGEALHRLWGKEAGVLINAAGIYGPKNVLEETSPEEWLQTILVNLYGTMLMTRELLPRMKKRKKGAIINFSGGGEGAFPRFSAYAASKGGVVRFTESVAEEVREYGIRINAIAPGAVNSRLLDEAIAAGKTAIGKENYAGFLKQKREGGVSPEKAAELCVFLASDKSAGITGRVLSAVWDSVATLPAHAKEIASSDVYTFRRVKPKDRGYEW